MSWIHFQVRWSTRWLRHQIQGQASLLTTFCFNTSLSRWVVKHLQYPHGTHGQWLQHISEGLAVLWQCSLLRLLVHSYQQQSCSPSEKSTKHPRDSEDNQKEYCVTSTCRRAPASTAARCFPLCVLYSTLLMWRRLMSTFVLHMSTYLGVSASNSISAWTFGQVQV